MRYILAKIDAEPVLFFALVQALIGVVTAFGFDLSAAQTTALLVCTSAILAIVCRGKVSPASNTVPARDEAGSVDLILLVAVVVGVTLLLFGIRFR